MDCDGLKKAFIADKDGSMLGERGTILAFSEFAWDADPRRGTGDYRLPQTMLTDVNGDPVEIEGMADYVARGTLVLFFLNILSLSFVMGPSFSSTGTF